MVPLRMGLLFLAVSLALILSVSAVSAAAYLGEFQVKESGLTVYDEAKVTLPGNYVITGLGIGMSYNPDRDSVNKVGAYVMKPIVVKARELRNDGSLGLEREFVLGDKNKIDKSIFLNSWSFHSNDYSYDYVVVGWGAKVKDAAAKGNSHINYFEITARKLYSNGSLGPETIFSTQSAITPDRRVKLDDGYVATYIGGRVAHGSLTKASIGGQRLVITDANQTIPPTNQTNQTGNQTNQTNMTNITNRAPILTLFNTSISAYEGDFIQIGYTASDQDNDVINVAFTSPFNNSGAWQTGAGDAGNYRINVTASDGKNLTMDFVNITITARPSNITNQTNQTNMTNITNRAPVINSLNYNGREEGDLFRINVDAYDPDGDFITTSCSAPFGSDCEWRTENGDKGRYEITVTVSDNKGSSTSGTISVKVKDGSTTTNDGNNLGSGIIRGGEFQDNDLALNNRLYYDEDETRRTETIALNQEAQTSASTKSSKTTSLLTIFLILILLLILVIIGVIYKRRK